MFNSNEGYSLADIAAATGKNNGFGGDGSAWWIIILFLFAFTGGWGNNGRGLFGGNDSTSSGITDGYILTSDFANIERKIDGVNNGICSLGYDQLAQMNAINQNVSTTGSGIINTLTQQNITNMQNTNSIGAQITALGNQVQSCCCNMTNNMDTQFGQLKYDLASQSCQTRQVVNDATRDIIDNQNANTRAILDFMTQDKIASLTSENAALKAAADNAAQTYSIVSQLRPSPSPAYIVANPYCNCGNAYAGCSC